MSHSTQPVDARFWTPGVLVLAAVMIAGGLALVARYTGGLGYVTNLSNSHPWGLWIAIDVASGVALAAGGFTTALLAHILGRHHYEAVTRPALLTAALGYTFVAFGVFLDIGRSWAIWKPVFFWNPNSALFEVAMCVVIYLHVLWIEFIPIIAERFGDRFAPLRWLDAGLDKVLWVFIILGVVLSCMHQSSLGTLLLIAPTKLHPLWFTPLQPLFFLLSAFAVGYPMVIFETTIATSSLKRDPEMSVLTPLSRFTVAILGLYLLLKVGDMMYRGTYVYLLDFSAQSNAFLVEMLLGVILPFGLLLSGRVRRSRRGLFTAACLIIGGVLINRINVFLIGFRPTYADGPYFPAIGEILITAGCVAAIMFLYRLMVTVFPVLGGSKEVTS
jgi:Ni/Fe-hydrogenase subunit HybB-like protein